MQRGRTGWWEVTVSKPFSDWGGLHHSFLPSWFFCILLLHVVSMVLLKLWALSAHLPSSHTDTLCFFPMESLAQDSPQLTAVSFLHIPVSHKNATVEQMLRINFYIYEFGLLRRRTTTKILCKLHSYWNRDLFPARALKRHLIHIYYNLCNIFKNPTKQTNKQ